MNIFKKKEKKIQEMDAPWYQFYDDIPRHIDYPDYSLYEAVLDIAVKYPNYTAYSYYGNNCSYEKFIMEIKQCSRAFKKMNINDGDVVTICMPNTPEAVICFYALNRLGAICNMIHPLSSEGEIKNYLNISDSKMIVAVDMVYEKISNIVEDTSVKDIVLVSVSNSMKKIMTIGYYLTKGRKIKKAHDEKVCYWKEFYAKGYNRIDNIPEHHDGNHPAAILYSGGTTGKSKGILLSNMNFNSVAIQELAINKALGLGVSILSIMPIFHGFGLGSCIHACLISGGRSILLPTFSAKRFDELLKKYHPNIIAGVPTLFEGLIQNKGMDGVDLSYMKCMLCGGDSLAPQLKHRIDDFLREHNATIQVRTAYGLTECVSGTCMMPKDISRDNSIGIPCPDSYFKIVEPNTHNTLPYGVDGEICISGPSVMMGYLKEPQETANTLQVHEDGRIWLHTGDLGCMDNDGFVYFKQRIKRMIISSGYNIYPQAIENVINDHPDVLTCTVIGVDHPYKVQVAKAFIVLKDGIEATASVKRSIREHCEKNIAKYSMPHEFEYRTSLPKTLVGKIAFNTLVEEEKAKRDKQ